MKMEPPKRLGRFSGVSQSGLSDGGDQNLIITTEQLQNIRDLLSESGLDADSLFEKAGLEPQTETTPGDSLSSTTDDLPAALGKYLGRRKAPSQED